LWLLLKFDFNSHQKTFDSRRRGVEMDTLEIDPAVVVVVLTVLYFFGYFICRALRKLPVWHRLKPK